MKAAKIKLEKTYKEALNFFNKQKEDLWKPDPKQESQRQAESQGQEERLKFAKGMSDAIASLDSIDYDGFKVKVNDVNALKQELQSVDSLLGKYKKGDDFDYVSLAKEAYIGRNFETLLKAHADYVLTKSTEAELAKLSNKKDVGSYNTTGGQTPEQIREQLRKAMNGI
jgi:hypothetical protein